ncbi:MAG: cyclase family protein [Flavobacteriales bacterium]|nr:cyclase family protein [Flavobacteriales bacterium]
MRYLLSSSIVLLALSCATPRPEPGVAAPDPASLLSEATWIDLSHDFSDSTIYWPNNPTGFELHVESEGVTPGGWYYSSNSICAPEHGGTHMDAPVHFAEGKHTSEEVPLDQLIGKACVLDVTSAVGDDADHLVSVAEVEEWERANGRIPDGAIVLVRTGWGKYYDDRAKCLGTAEKGADAIPHLHFPGIDPALATWLIEHRKPKAVGLDTPSLDRGQSTDFMTHRLLFEANIPGFENVASLEQVPAHGAFVVALPMKIKGGTGGPLRIVACVPADK